MKIFKTISLIIFVFIFINIITTKNVKAGYWGEDLMSEMMGQMMDEIQQAIYDALLGEFKQSAVETISGEIDNLIAGGGGGEALFITDWQEWLFDNPRSETDVYMNDFFTIVTRGQSSSVNYSSNGTGFERWRSDFAKQFIGKTDYSNLESNFEEYATNVDGMFDNGNWQAFSEFLNNNHLSLALEAQEAELEAQEKFEKEAEMQGGSYDGYKPTFASDGKTITTPGSTIKNIKDQVDAMPFTAIASANSIPEVIVATVSKLITSTITEGIGNSSNTSTSTSGNCITGDCGNGSSWTNPDTSLPF